MISYKYVLLLLITAPNYALSHDTYYNTRGEDFNITVLFLLLIYLKLNKINKTGYQMQWYHRPTLLLRISCICVCHVLSMHLTGFLSCKSKWVTYLIGNSRSRLFQEFWKNSDGNLIRILSSGIPPGETRCLWNYSRIIFRHAKEQVCNLNSNVVWHRIRPGAQYDEINAISV